MNTLNWITAVIGCVILLLSILALVSATKHILPATRSTTQWIVMVALITALGSIYTLNILWAVPSVVFSLWYLHRIWKYRVQKKIVKEKGGHTASCLRP